MRRQSWFGVYGFDGFQELKKSLDLSYKLVKAFNSQLALCNYFDTYHKDPSLEFDRYRCYMYVQRNKTLINNHEKFSVCFLREGPKIEKYFWTGHQSYSYAEIRNLSDKDREEIHQFAMKSSEQMLKKGK